MASKPKKLSTIRPRNNGLVVGSVAALICVALLGAAGWGGTYLYRSGYGTANAQAQVNQQLTDIRTQLAADLDRRLPPVRPNGPINNFGVDQNGQPNHAAGNVIGLYDELHGENTALKGDIVSLKDVTKAQGDAMKAATENLATQMAAQAARQSATDEKLTNGITAVSGKVDDLVGRMGKVEAALATPAPAPAPQPQAPAATPAAPANQAPAMTSQAAPVGPQASAQAQTRFAGNGNFVTPQTASELEKAYMVGALKTLGQAPAKLSGFEVTKHVGDFECPDGSKKIKVGGHMGADKVFYARWACPHVAQ